MAAKLTVQFDEKLLERVKKKLKRLKKPLTRNDANELGVDVVDRMKKSISKGSGTIKGFRRFEKYRGGYRDQIKKKGYVRVGKTKISKKLRPINLKLTGSFLASLANKVSSDKNGYSTIIGIFGAKQIEKEKGHRAGGTKKHPNTQGVRPILPTKKGEQFTSIIQQTIIKFLNKVIKKQIKKK